MPGPGWSARAAAVVVAVLGIVLGIGLVVAAGPAAPAALAAAGAAPTPIDLGGTPRAGSSNPAEPTVVTAGLWADTLTGPGAPEANARWFEYRRTMAGSTVLVGATATSSESSDGIEVSVVAPDGTSCGNASSTPGLPVTFSAFGAAVVAPDGTFGERDDPCLSSDRLAIRVDRYTSEATGELPFALRVVEEAPVVSPETDLPTPPTETVAPTPEPVEPEDVAGAGSFDGAPDLTTGTWADAVREGTERLYRVRLDWGQALAVRVEVPAADEAVAEDLGGGPTVSLTLFDPLRNSFTGGAEDAEVQLTWSTEDGSLFTGTVPVGYLQRFDGSTVTTPGDYWFSLSASAAPDDRDAVEVPVEIAVEVVGEPTGAPDFATTVQAPDSGPGPAAYDPATPYLVGEGQFAADVSGRPRAPEAEDPAGSVRRVAGGALGVVSLLCLGAGVVLLRRRVSPAAAR